MSVELDEQEVENKEDASEEESSPEQQEAEEEQSEEATSGEESDDKAMQLLEQLTEQGGVNKRADGKFEWVVDPDDPKSTRYVGSTLSELLQNARKGFADKDRYISELKSRDFGAEKPGRRNDRVERQQDEGEDTDFESLVPNREVIIDDMMKARGLDPAMRRWSNAEWREFADEKQMRDFEVSRLQAKVDQTEAEGVRTYQEQSIEYVDARSLKDASEEVKQYLLDRKIDPDEVVDIYQDVVSRTWEDPTFRKVNGLYNGSKLVRVMIAEIDKKLKPSSSSQQAKEKLDAAKKAAEEARKNISTTRSSGAKPKVKESEPKDIRDAKKQLLAGMAAGRTYNE